MPNFGLDTFSSNTVAAESSEIFSVPGDSINEHRGKASRKDWTLNASNLFHYVQGRCLQVVYNCLQIRQLFVHEVILLG